MYSGGTVVTVFGSDLNSVAQPLITLTVIITRINNDTNCTSYENKTDLGVTVFSCIVMNITL